jgi:hypothetical protein
MAKAIRKTPLSIDKEVREGRRKRITYLVERSGTIEFNPPVLTHWNRGSGNHFTLESLDDTGKLSFPGKLGTVTRYFIPKKELADLQSLLSRFHIPVELHSDLIWCYLNMAFAAANAAASDQSMASQDSQLLALRKLLDLLAMLEAGTAKITTGEISYTTIATKSGKAAAVKTLKLQGPLDTGYLEDVLKLYRQVKETEMLEDFSRSVVKSPEDRLVTGNMGHKNAQKHAQSYYANQLYAYLIKNVFSSLTAYFNDPPRLKEETAKLKKIYSDRQLCHFIGDLIILAGLLPPPKNYPDVAEALIDLIKKKIAGQLVARAAQFKELVGKNRKAK